MFTRLRIGLSILVLVLAGLGLAGVANSIPPASQADRLAWPNPIGAPDLVAPDPSGLWRSAGWEPFGSPASEWRVWRSEHFRLHVLPGTAAARDVSPIAAEAEASLERMSARLDLSFDGTMDLYLVERIFWQGGAAYGGFQVLVSYADRSYVDIPLRAYLDHELTHALAQRLHVDSGHWNSLMAEGLAVWAAGGHYGPEPVHAMAAALVPMGKYVPIQKLLDDFHAQQHEIAYIEAGSFVGFLIERYGLATVKQFYAHADRPADYFGGKEYAELERDWLRWLAQPAGRRVIAAGPRYNERWWRLQIRFFDVMRAYQQQFEPLARTLPESPGEWSSFKRNAYANNPAGAAHLALESQLQAASQGLYCGDLESAARRLDEVEAGATAGEVVGGEARQRLRIAGLLEGQDRALGRRDLEAYVGTGNRSLQARVAAALRDVSSSTGLRQELVRLWLNERSSRAIAWVSWFPRADTSPGTTAPTAAFRLTFTRGDGDRWQLTDFQPLVTTELISRSQRLCNPSLEVSS